MIFRSICSILFISITSSVSVRKEIPIPYITPRDPNDTRTRGVVIFDGSGNNNTLPFTEVAGGDGYICKSSECYSKSEFGKKEKGLEAMQSQTESPQEFLYANMAY